MTIVYDKKMKNMIFWKSHYFGMSMPVVYQSHCISLHGEILRIIRLRIL